jgi:recombination protein RecA
MAKKKLSNSNQDAEDIYSDNVELYDELKKNKTFGVVDPDSVDLTKDNSWISTGSFLLDAMITNSYIDKETGEFKGGIIGGKILSISGLNSTGKSILAAHILKSAQQIPGTICVYIDAEQAVNKPFFEAVGVDFSKEKLIYSQSNIVENNFNLIVKIIESVIASKNPNRLGLIVWDSIASTTTLAELEEKFGDGTFGHLAKQVSQGMRKLNGFLNKHNIAIVFTNQLRMKIGASKYEDPYVEPSGMAIPFYSSLSLRLLRPRKSDIILNNKGQQIGTAIRLKFSKNRYGPPQNDFEIPLYYGHGIDEDHNWYRFFKEKGYIVSRKSKDIDYSTISIPGIDEEKIETRMWKRWLIENIERKEKIKKVILDEIKIDLNSEDLY